jgi:hypothetical protein
MMWHNFHTHGQRWHFAGEAYDGRSLGPAESFVVETTAPPVLLLPPDIANAQDPECRPKHAKKYHVRGDFLFHCHVEMHMMAGLAGLVRSRQTLWLTPEQAKRLAHETGLPIDHGDNDCPAIDPTHCESLDCGKWEEVAGSPSVTFMHACLLPKTDKVLYWGYGDARDDISRIWDYSTPAGAFSLPANQPFDVTSPVNDRVVGGARVPRCFAGDPADSWRLHPARVVFVRPAYLNLVESGAHDGTAFLLHESDAGQRQSADHPRGHSNIDRLSIDGSLRAWHWNMGSADCIADHF